MVSNEDLITASIILTRRQKQSEANKRRYFREKYMILENSTVNYCRRRFLLPCLSCTEVVVFSAFCACA